MKTPDTRPRFQSATRHYHRYREDRRDAWSEWIDGAAAKKPASRHRAWWLATLAILGLSAAIGAIYFQMV